MEQNKENGTASERKQSSVGCSCGCGAGKSANMVFIAIWVAAALGFACFVAVSRANVKKNPERLRMQAQQLFDKKDYAGGVELLRQAAELGDPWGQIYYGGSLKKGVGTAQDKTAAVEWFRKSAAQNCAVAFYELGDCYENGAGVERDLNEAEAWYRKALDSGIVKESQAALERVAKLKAEASPGDSETKPGDSEAKPGDSEAKPGEAE